MGDRGAQALASALPTLGLATLDVAFNNVSTAGVAALMQVSYVLVAGRTKEVHEAFSIPPHQGVPLCFLRLFVSPLFFCFLFFVFGFWFFFIFGYLFVVSSSFLPLDCVLLLDEMKKSLLVGPVFPDRPYCHHIAMPRRLQLLDSLSPGDG